jgi:hypothetical protein
MSSCMMKCDGMCFLFEDRDRADIVMEGSVRVRLRQGSFWFGLGRRQLCPPQRGKILPEQVRAEGFHRCKI